MNQPNNAMELEQAHVLQTYGRPPFVIDHGQGCWVTDTEGNSYLDCVAGIAVNALGHAHPALVAALTEQAGKLWHVSNLYHSEPQARLAQALCSSSFADRVFFCNSGAEANEGAMKFARKWAHDSFGPDKHDIVTFTNAFHGRTFGALAVTPKEKYQAAFRPLLPGVRVAPFNDLAAASEAIDDAVCAVIVEPVQGEGGIHPADESFLRGLRELCDQHNALLIFDEVQCGLGRTGTLWAHQATGVTPDLLTAAKPLAGGLPMGAVLMTERVAGVMHRRSRQAPSPAHPGHGRRQAVLAQVNQPEFLAGVAQKSRIFASGWRSSTRPSSPRCAKGADDRHGPHHSCIADRGCGLPPRAAARQRGPSTLRLVPPLIISHAEIDTLIERLTAVFTEVQEAQ